MVIVESNGPTIAIAADNDVRIAEDADLRKASIIVKGRGNLLVIEPGVALLGSKIEMTADNNSIFIGRQTRFKGAILCKSTGGATVRIGEKSTFGHANILAAEGRTISIGADCMFSWSVEVRSTDSHPMFDLDTGERINEGRDIFVGDHCWVGAKSHLLKGAHIPDGSVVAIGATVTKAFTEQNCVLAGTPAKIIKHRVRWERTHLG